MPSFDTPEPIDVTVEVVVGDLRIAAADRPDTVVDVRPSDPGADLDVRAAEQTRVEFADGRLLIKAPKQRGLGLFGRPGSIDVEVKLPAGSRLHAEAGIATVSGTGRLGETRVRTGVGDVRLDTTGPLELSTGSGGVVVGTVTGTARVTSGAGEVRVGAVDGAATVKNSTGDTWIGQARGTLRASAGNGSIMIERATAGVTATSGNGAIRVDEAVGGVVAVQTSMGELEIGIPSGTAAYLDLNTKFGNVVNRLATAAAPPAGASTVEVRGRTSYGDIIVRRPGTES